MLNFSRSLLLCAFLALPLAPSFASTEENDANICRITDWTGTFIGQIQFKTQNEGFLWFQTAEDYSKNQITRDLRSFYDSIPSKQEYNKQVNRYFTYQLNYTQRIEGDNLVFVYTHNAQKFQRNKELIQTLRVTWSGPGCVKTINFINGMGKEERSQTGGAIDRAVLFSAVSNLDALLAVSNAGSPAPRSLEQRDDGRWWEVFSNTSYFEVR